MTVLRLIYFIVYILENIVTLFGLGTFVTYVRDVFVEHVGGICKFKPIIISPFIIMRLCWIDVFCDTSVLVPGLQFYISLLIIGLCLIEFNICIDGYNNCIMVFRKFIG